MNFKIFPLVKVSTNHITENTPPIMSYQDFNSLKQERVKREQEEKAKIYKSLEESGEKKRLKELLQSRLQQTGWYEELRKHLQSK